ncbi:MAG: outer membrane beta-barrel protein [Acidobacteriota bacterium]|nr:outer membrane beta-barrel protein [Acidobacteriota bacterium]
MNIRFRLLAAAALATALVPVTVAAQTLSIGPRMSFVRADQTPGSPSDRYTGGALRMKLSPRTALELAVDFRSTTSEDATVRIRDYPFQGSLLLYPVRAGISPFLLGGVGWYSQRMQALSGGAVVSEETVRRMGYHGGLGGELRLGSRMTLHADYRYTFLGFGDDDGAAGAGGGAGIPGIGSVMDYFRVSHEGSMWSGGITFGF